MVDWGVTAETSAWEPVSYAVDLQELYSEFGDYPSHAFFRTVAPGVEYHEPPPISRLRKWLRRKAEWQLVFLMPYPGETAPASEDLLDIQASLAGRRASLKEGDTDLLRLDAAVDRFLGVVCELHEKHVPLGLVHPRSVRFVHDASSVETVQLPDLGFVFDVDSRAAVLPKWLEDGSMRVLFDDGADTRNERYLEWIRQPSHGTFEPLKYQDVKIVGRLLAYALAGDAEVRKWSGGRCLDAVPPPCGTLNDTACAPVWDAINGAISGRTLSVAELREALRRDDARPSRHFLVKPEPPEPSPRLLETLLKRAAKPFAASAGAILVVWAAYALWQAFAPHYTSICPHVSSWDKDLYPRLKDLEAQKTTAAASDEGKQRFVQAIKDYVALLRANPNHPCDESCTEQLVAMSEPWLDEEVTVTLENLRKHPRQTAEEVVILRAERALVDELNSLRRETAPPLFQSAAQRLDRQLSLRGATVADGGKLPAEAASP